MTKARHIGLRVFATPGALREFELSFLLACLDRHRRGDWGDVCAEDAKANDRAVAAGARLVSAYSLAGKRLWAITEAEGGPTTLLLPEEY